MAHEVKPWKKPNCDITLKVEMLSERETYSREINEKYGEGGGLNANYRIVEAVAMVTNMLGCNGMWYGIDFIFKTGGGDLISFDFRDEETKARATLFLRGLL